MCSLAHALNTAYGSVPEAPHALCPAQMFVFIKPHVQNYRIIDKVKGVLLPLSTGWLPLVPDRVRPSLMSSVARWTMGLFEKASGGRLVRVA